MNVKELNCLHISEPIKKSIELMDEFTDSDKNYDALILDGWFKVYKKEGNNYSISLVVSEVQPQGKICSDDIIMTHLKEMRHHHIWPHYYWDREPFGILPSVTKTFLECDSELFDTGELIPLEYAVHLRAQTSWNRVGYGWEWEWSGGIADYTEGTFYGETTDFYITHILINTIQRVKTLTEIRDEKILALQEQLFQLEQETENAISNNILSGINMAHKKFGAGRVIALNKFGTLKVDFLTHGEKGLGLQDVLKKSLIFFDNEDEESIVRYVASLPEKVKMIEQEIISLKDASYGELIELIYGK